MFGFFSFLYILNSANSETYVALLYLQDFTLVFNILFCPIMYIVLQLDTWFLLLVVLPIANIWARIFKWACVSKSNWYCRVYTSRLSFYCLRNSFNFLFREVHLYMFSLVCKVLNNYLCYCSIICICIPVTPMYVAGDLFDL